MFSQEHNFFCNYLARPECPQFVFMFSWNGLLGQKFRTLLLQSSG